MEKLRLIAGIFIIILFLIGITAIFCGFLMVSTPLALIVLGCILIAISILFNYMIPSKKGGD